MDVERCRANAAAALDREFGLGKAIVHANIKTDPVAKAIYECAIKALTRYEMALKKSEQREGSLLDASQDLKAVL